MYIMRVCKYYGLSIKQLDLLFDSLIMSIFTFAIELWGCAYDGKYLNHIDKFIKYAHKNGYISKRTHIKEIRDKRDKKLWNKITSTEDNALLELLPEKRSRLLRPRGHEYELPLVRTERFKRKSQLHGLSCRVTPKSFSHVFRLIEGISSGKTTEVCLRTTISYVFSKFKGILFSSAQFCKTGSFRSRCVTTFVARHS